MLTFFLCYQLMFLLFFIIHLLLCGVNVLVSPVLFVGYFFFLWYSHIIWHIVLEGACSATELKPFTRNYDCKTWWEQLFALVTLSLVAIQSWSLSNYLTAKVEKRKLGDPSHSWWMSENSLVMCWLLHPMQPDIIRSLYFFALHTIFGQQQNFVFLRTLYNIWTAANKLILDSVMISSF